MVQARPQIAFVSSLSAAEIEERFRVALADPDCPVEGQIFPKHIDLLMSAEQRHFWSPWLPLDVAVGEAGTELRGRFGPHPNVWTAFVFVYSVLAVLAVVALCFGGAQLMLGTSPWAFGVMAACLALGAFIYGAEFIGKGMGSEQMWVMRDFVARVVGEAI